MAATSAGTQNPNEHMCGMVSRWDIRYSVGWLCLWRGCPSVRWVSCLLDPLALVSKITLIGGGSSLTIIELVFSRAFRWDCHFSSSKYEMKFLFLDPSMSNLVNLFSFSFSSNRLVFFHILYIIRPYLFIRSKISR